MQVQRITYKKIILMTALFVLGGCLLVYFLTSNKVDNKFKDQQNKGGSVSISTEDLKDDFISLQQGTGTPQTGNINITGDITAGSNIQGSSITSNAQDGTSPLNVYSSTLVNNLNSDMVDGKHAEELSKPSTGTTVNNITNTITGESIAQSTTSEYFRGDKSWQTLNKSAVGLSNVENTALSAWVGSTNITTVGTISGNFVATGTINGATLSGGSVSGGTIQGGTLTAIAVNGVTTGNILLSTGTYADPSWITSLAGSKVSGNISGSAAGLTGTPNITVGTIASGLINGQTISSSANFTGTITAASTIATPNIRVAMYPTDDTNPDLVNAGGYTEAVEGAADFGGGSAPYSERTVLYNHHTSRIRQDGSIENFKMYFASKPANITAFYFQIWRKSGTTWNQVYSEEEWAKVSGGSTNTITLTIPALVQEGDYVAIRWSMNGADPGNFSRYVAGNAYSTTTYTINSAVPSTSNYDFTAGTVGTVYAPINVYMRAPMFVEIGDSIISGWGGSPHNSFVDPFADYNYKEATIGYQLAQSLGWTHQNMGVTEQIVATIQARFANDVVALKPKFVVIEGGINDAYVATPTSVPSLVASWTDMLNQARNTGITPVMLKILPSRYPTNEKMTLVDQYNAAMTTLVSQYNIDYPNANVILVDAAPEIGEYRSGGPAGNLWDSRTEFTSGIHYNYAGHNRIAKAILAALPTAQVVKGQLTVSDILVNGRIELAGGTGTRYIEPQKSPSYEQTGADLMVKAGSPSGTELSVDKNGGSLYLSGGDSIGTGSSNIYLQTTASGATGTAQNSPVTRMAILGDGKVQVVRGTEGAGTVTITGGTTCTGTGTSFTTTFKVGDNIVISKSGETRAISVITSDTVMTIASATNITASTYTRISLTLLPSGNVGIGVDTPNNLIQVAGLVNFGGTNTSLGYLAGNSNTGTVNNIGNVAVGYQALYTNNVNGNNTAIGRAALYTNTGYGNSAVGLQGLERNETGNYNVSMGVNALRYNTTGSYNTAIGFKAGYTGTSGAYANTTGSNNTFIGYNSGPGTATQYTNATAIGYNALVSQSNSMVLGGTGADGVNVGIGTTTPSATLHLRAGTAAASTAPIKLTAGTLMATPEIGAVEYDGTNAYITLGDAVRREILVGHSGTTASIGGGALGAGACASANTTVTGAATTMPVATSPNTYPGDGFVWQSYVSAADTVTTKVCALVAGTPTASTYNVRVIK